MDKAKRYLEAGTRDNTRKSYRAAVEHYESTWGGFLPATAEGIVRYLAEYAEILSLSTLRQRLAALAQWHISQGFPDPTKAPQVRQMLKGIRAVHPAQQKQAAPLQLRHLQKVVAWLDNKAAEAIEAGDYQSLMRYRRDSALLLIGFWRGFRSDELARLRVETTQAEAGVGITFYLPYSKTDRDYQGSTFYTPALKQLCPVEAYINWITVSGIVDGPIFRKLDRWGNLSDSGFRASSLTPLLRRILEAAGIPAAAYSSHSMRRGFATWASTNGWDIKGLMTYVGWRDMKSALKYVDASNSFGNLAAQSQSIDVLEKT
jgi:integrase